MSCSARVIRLTPSTIILRALRPQIFAPSLCENQPESHTSGSCAAPSITVVFARTAAIITLSVPSSSWSEFAPQSNHARHVSCGKTFTLPAFYSHRRADASNPVKCKSIGPDRRMTQPPGRETVVPCTARGRFRKHADGGPHFRTTSYGCERPIARCRRDVTIPLAASN